jgi:exodeoxyribonuclease X
MGAPAHVKRICTHAISQHLWPDADGYSQVALLYMLLGATHQTRELVRGAHGAGVDACNNLILLEHILKAKPEITTWSGLWAFSEECRIPLKCPMRRNRGVPLAELDRGFIDWCLRQHWLDPYFRKGLERVVERHSENHAIVDAEDRDDDVPY